MIKKKRILILASGQFGYSTTIFRFCEYSMQNFEITYIGWDYNKPKIFLSGIKVLNVKRDSNLLLRNFRLLNAFQKEVPNNYDLIFSSYVRGISFVKIFNPKTKFLIFIDTFGVMPGNRKRWVYDLFLKYEVSFFSHVAVISDGLGKRLGNKRYEILPLGGECFTTESKSFEKLELLYVGTLDNRNIIDCVRGFHQYLQKYEFEDYTTIFKIIGNGPNNELDEIRDYVKINNLTENIFVIGYVPQHQLATYFKSANIGVSYIPMFPYFEYQTPTKTYEYLISGLPVIATGTYENRKIIKSWSGIIIEDNAEAFCEGVASLQHKKKEFNSNRIRDEYTLHSWENAVRSYFIPQIEKLTSN